MTATSRRPDRPPAAVEVAGYSIAVRAGRVYVVDRRLGDPDLSPAQARSLATAIAAAADAAQRQQQRRPQPPRPTRGRETA